MTIRLLTDWPYKRASNAGYVTIPAGSIVSVFDAATETGMIAAKVAAASAAAVTWTPPSDAPIYTELLPAEVAATRSLVSVAGNVVTQAGVASVTPVEVGVYGQFANGTYLTYDMWQGATFGVGRQRLAVYNGDPSLGVDTALLTVIAQTNTAISNGLLKPDGSAIDYTNAFVYHAWIAPNQDVFFLVVENGNRYFLYRAKTGTFTVGSDAAYSNKRASLALGLQGGTQADQCRIFTGKALCFADINGATHIYFAEYNVSAGRVSGTGAAGKDQVLCHRSTDGGETFSIFMEFNTGGSHAVDHFHGVVQCPYSKLIYLMTGDSNAENALIMYNGTAAAVAANTSLADIATTAGYKVIFGSELHRYTDLCFGPQTVFSIPDADTEASDTKTTAYVSTVLNKTLDFVSTIAPVDRVDNLPPAITLQTSAKAALMLSFCTTLARAAGNAFLEMWSADYEGGSWTRIARFQNQHPSSAGVAKTMFEDNLGRVWISGTTYANGLSFWAAHSNNNQSSALVLTMTQGKAQSLLYWGV